MSDVLQADREATEGTFEEGIRPRRLEDFVGQERLTDNLAVFINAARDRGESLDHILFFGPPGLGKTTLAHIVATAMGAEFHISSGPVLEKAGDLAAILTNLQEGDVLFLDEIHRLSPAVEEILYPAMEDFELDLVIGEGPAARSVRLTLPPFTLVAATTRTGLLTAPLRDRFGIVSRLEFYERDDLASITRRSARILNIAITDDAAFEVEGFEEEGFEVAGCVVGHIRHFLSVAVGEVRLGRNCAEFNLCDA